MADSKGSGASPQPIYLEFGTGRMSSGGPRTDIEMSSGASSRGVDLELEPEAS